MKILEIIKGLDIGGINGGAERFAADLSLALSKKGIQVDLCIFFGTNTETEAKWCKKLQENNVNVIVPGKWMGNHRLDEFFLSTHRLGKYVDIGSYHILHSHTQFGTLASLLLKRNKPVRVVRTAHITKEWGDTFYNKVQKFVWGDIFFPLFVDAQVAVSNAVKKSVEGYWFQRFIDKEIFIIYNSIPFPEEFPVSKDILGKKREFVIGTAARLFEQKGLFYLLEAANIVRLYYPNVKFLIAGEGELRKQIQEKIYQSNLQDYVLLIGNHPNIYEFLSHLDLFVLPSLFEGLPTVIIEAMAAGVPVVATNIPGTDELIQNDINGWLVAPQNSTALASAIMEAICSPQKRKRYIEAGHARAMDFSIDKAADEYIQLFEKLL